MLTPGIVNREAEGAVGYVLIGHGTRREAGQRQLREVFQHFADLLSPSPAELAYLELAEPTIPDAVYRLARRGVSQLIVVPALLFAAGHALTDIPLVVGDAAAKVGIAIVGQSTPLESSEGVLELSALRFRQAVFPVGQPTHRTGSCQEIRYQELALAMIGRGSRSKAATEKMNIFAKRRRQITPVARLEIGFIYGQSPSVPEVFQKLAQSHYPTIVVQPHLLFEGELIDRLREQVAEFQRQNPDQRWKITETLGTDFALAKTLVALAADAISIV